MARLKVPNYSMYIDSLCLVMVRFECDVYCYSVIRIRRMAFWIKCQIGFAGLRLSVMRQVHCATDQFKLRFICCLLLQLGNIHFVFPFGPTPFLPIEISLLADSSDAEAPNTADNVEIISTVYIGMARIKRSLF